MTRGKISMKRILIVSELNSLILYIEPIKVSAMRYNMYSHTSNNVLNT